MDIIVWLNIILVILVAIIIGLGLLYFFVVYRNKQLKEEKEEEKEAQKNLTSFNGIPKDEITKIMEFDEIKDDMIVRKNNEQFVMVIQCKGINYDLLSEEEKLSVEEGFVQFLNTLRFPVQLYVQTRSLNLKNTIEEYKMRVDSIAEEMRDIEARRIEATKNGNIELASRLAFELKRKQNVLEYGTDISEYIGRMSLNKNVLQQKTYVVISYYASEAGNISNYSKDEVRSICFSELYTRCQAVMRTLSTAQVSGRILSSEELTELLYIAYNRDDSEIYQLSKALDAEYDAIYSTAKDVLEKKKEKIEEEFEVAAIELATDSIVAADKKLRDEQARKAKLKEKAMEVLDEYKEQMQPELYEATKQEIKNSGKEETIEETVEVPKKITRTTRKRKLE